MSQTAIPRLNSTVIICLLGLGFLLYVLPERTSIIDNGNNSVAYTFASVCTIYDQGDGEANSRTIERVLNLASLGACPDDAVNFGSVSYSLALPIDITGLPGNHHFRVDGHNAIMTVYPSDDR